MWQRWVLDHAPSWILASELTTDAGWQSVEPEHCSTFVTAVWSVRDGRDIPAVDESRRSGGISSRGRNASTLSGSRLVSPSRPSRATDRLVMLKDVVDKFERRTLLDVVEARRSKRLCSNWLTPAHISSSSTSATGANAALARLSASPGVCRELRRRAEAEESPPKALREDRRGTAHVLLTLDISAGCILEALEMCLIRDRVWRTSCKASALISESRNAAAAASELGLPVSVFEWSDTLLSSELRRDAIEPRRDATEPRRDNIRPIESWRIREG